jgi:hypothetical protein
MAFYFYRQIVRSFVFEYAKKCWVFVQDLFVFIYLWENKFYFDEEMRKISEVFFFFFFKLRYDNLWSVVEKREKEEIEYMWVYSKVHEKLRKVVKDGDEREGWRAYPVSGDREGEKQSSP